jgi:hypothetical protein
MVEGPVLVLLHAPSHTPHMQQPRRTYPSWTPRRRAPVVIMPRRDRGLFPARLFTFVSEWLKA